MNSLHIIERIDDEVLWIYRGFDGVSVIRDFQVRDSELCYDEIFLNKDTCAEINKAVSDWLRDSGEGDKWMAEQF